MWGKKERERKRKKRKIMYLVDYLFFCQAYSLCFDRSPISVGWFAVDNCCGNGLVWFFKL